MPLTGAVTTRTQKQERLFTPASVLKFDPNQPRDKDGKWTEGGGGTPEQATLGLASTGTSKEAQAKEYQALRDRWAAVNDELFNEITSPDSPEAHKKLDEMKSLVKQMHRLDADPGTFEEGVGLPGGPRDVIIVGAGPGGLSAAINGGVEGLDTLFIDANPDVGGQAKHSSRIENFGGFPAGISGEDLAGRMHEQAQRNGAEGLLGVRVVGIAHDPETGLKTVTLSDGRTMTSRSVILAGGIEFRKMEFPGSDAEDLVYADSKKLTKIGKGQPVVVVGGSNGAAQAALGALKGGAQHVTVLSRSPIVKGMSKYQTDALDHFVKQGRMTVIEGDEIAAIEKKDGQTETLVTKKGQRLPAGAVGVFIGGSSNTKWLEKSLTLQNGKIPVNSDLETEIPGVFAVGDTRVGGAGRVGAALGEGQVAIANVFKYFTRRSAAGQQTHG